LRNRILPQLYGVNQIDRAQKILSHMQLSLVHTPVFTGVFLWRGASRAIA